MVGRKSAILLMIINIIHTFIIICNVIEKLTNIIIMNCGLLINKQGYSY